MLWFINGPGGGSINGLGGATVGRKIIDNLVFGTGINQKILSGFVKIINLNNPIGFITYKF